MVLASPTAVRADRVRAAAIPVVDLSGDRDHISELIVRACEELGFFQVINHGVPHHVVANMEAKGMDFFALPADEKQRAGPPSPLGYGSKSIGLSGDTGEVEYLLLHTNRSSVSQRAKAICRKDPSKFSCVVNEYVEAVRELACEILELLAGGLGLADRGALSKLIRDSESDSLLRLNYYPSCHSNNNSSNKNNNIKAKDTHDSGKDSRGSSRIGFGEHSDPQILTLLRSNDVEGLQIMPPSSSEGGGAWVPVPPDPTSFCVNVGDALQALTNGRLLSVRHRAMACSYSSRLSLVFFCAPPLHAWISPFPEMITPDRPRRYKSFTWAEYKKAMYSFRLAHNRLDLFQADNAEEEISDLTK